MSYNYETERANIFTEDGTKMLLNIKREVNLAIAVAGAVTAEKAISKCAGSTWTMLACLDYLVELGHVREVTGPDVWGQHRVFVKGSAA